MLEYQDYEDDFKELNIKENEAVMVLDYLDKIIEIAIETYNEQR